MRGGYIRGVCVDSVVAEDVWSIQGIGACGDKALSCDGCVVDGRGVCEWSLGCRVRATCADNEMGPGGATEVAGALRGMTTLTSLDLAGEQRLCCGVGVMWREDMDRGP